MQGAGQSVGGRRSHAGQGGGHSLSHTCLVSATTGQTWRGELQAAGYLTLPTS